MIDGIVARVGWLAMLVGIAAIAWSSSSRPGGDDPAATIDPAVTIANQARWQACQARAIALLEQRSRVDDQWVREVEAAAAAQTDAERNARQTLVAELLSRSIRLQFEIWLETLAADEIEPFAGFALERIVAKRSAELVERAQLTRAVERALDKLHRDPPCLFGDESPAREKLRELKEQQRVLVERLRAAQQPTRPAPRPRPRVTISKECLEDVLCRPVTNRAETH